MINDFFPCSESKNGFKNWQFFCLLWNGIAGSVKYHGSGYSKTGNVHLIAEFPAGRNFSIASLWSNNTGYLTQLNIWDYELPQASISAMLAGGFNIHGNTLSWSRLSRYFPADHINWNTEIYIPGKKNSVYFNYGMFPIYIYR